MRMECVSSCTQGSGSWTTLLIESLEVIYIDDNMIVVSFASPKPPQAPRFYTPSGSGLQSNVAQAQHSYMADDI